MGPPTAHGHAYGHAHGWSAWAAGGWAVQMIAWGDGGWAEQMGGKVQGGAQGYTHAHAAAGWGAKHMGTGEHVIAAAAGSAAVHRRAAQAAAAAAGWAAKVMGTGEHIIAAAGWAVVHGLKWYGQHGQHGQTAAAAGANMHAGVGGGEHG